MVSIAGLNIINCRPSAVAIIWFTENTALVDADSVRRLVNPVCLCPDPVQEATQPEGGLPRAAKSRVELGRRSGRGGGDCLVGGVLTTKKIRSSRLSSFKTIPVENVAVLLAVSVISANRETLSDGIR